MVRKDSGAVNILSIECAVGRGSIAVLSGQSILASSVNSSASPSRAEEVLQIANETLGSSGLALGDIDQITVSTGPGSYSGIRIGIATALGLKAALQIECVGVSVLEAIAFSSNSAGNVVAAVPVGKRDVAWQAFERTPDKFDSSSVPALLPEANFLLELEKLTDLILLSHSDLHARLVTEGVPPGIVIVDAGTNLAALTGVYSTSETASTALHPMYLRNQDHQRGSLLPA